MRTYDFSPLYRSTIGFDRLFDRLRNVGWSAGARPAKAAPAQSVTTNHLRLSEAVNPRPRT